MVVGDKVRTTRQHDDIYHYCTIIYDDPIEKSSWFCKSLEGRVFRRLETELNKISEIELLLYY